MVGPHLTREQAHAMRQSNPISKDKLIMESHIAVMIDLETMGTQSDSVIAAVAAAKCDLSADKFTIMEEPFYDIVDLDQPGRKFYPETVRWWLQQHEAARQIFSRQIHPTPLSNVLIRLSQYIKPSNITTVWSKGVDFDIVILNHAYAKKKLSFYHPWDYKQQQCFRTIVNLHDPNKTVEPPENPIDKHNAKHDAVHQLWWLYNIWQREGGLSIKSNTIQGGTV